MPVQFFHQCSPTRNVESGRARGRMGAIDLPLHHGPSPPSSAPARRNRPSAASRVRARRLRRIGEQPLDLRRTEVAWIDDALASLRSPGRNADLLRSRASPLEFDAGMGKASSQNSRTECSSPVPTTQSSGCSCLKNQPHRLDEITRKAPVAAGFQVSERDPVAAAGGDLCHRPGDLAGDEVLPPSGRLVVEQNPVAGEQPVRFAIIDGRPEGVELGHRVRRPGVERGLFGLRHLSQPGRTAPTTKPDRSETRAPLSAPPRAAEPHRDRKRLRCRSACRTRSRHGTGPRDCRPRRACTFSRMVASDSASPRSP